MNIVDTKERRIPLVDLAVVILPLGVVSINSLLGMAHKIMHPTDHAEVTEAPLQHEGWQMVGSKDSPTLAVEETMPKLISWLQRTFMTIMLHHYRQKSQ